MSRPPHRRVSRILLYDERDAVLLMLTSSPLLSTPVIRWLTPGGGVEPHETHHEGAVRELYEETGLMVDNLGEPVWTVHGQSEFADGTVQTTYAEFFRTRTNRFDPVNDNWMENEHVDITGIRWWTADELEQSGELFAPLNLPDLIRAHAL